jgi:hypothetical protein
MMKRIVVTIAFLALLVLGVMQCDHCSQKSKDILLSTMPSVITYQVQNAGFAYYIDNIAYDKLIAGNIVITDYWEFNYTHNKWEHSTNEAIILENRSYITRVEDLK